MKISFEKRTFDYNNDREKSVSIAENTIRLIESLKQTNKVLLSRNKDLNAQHMGCKKQFDSKEFEIEQLVEANLKLSEAIASDLGNLKGENPELYSSSEDSSDIDNYGIGLDHEKVKKQNLLLSSTLLHIVQLLSCVGVTTTMFCSFASFLKDIDLTIFLESHPVLGAMSHVLPIQVALGMSLNENKFTATCGIILVATTSLFYNTNPGLVAPIIIANGIGAAVGMLLFKGLENDLKMQRCNAEKAV